MAALFIRVSALGAALCCTAGPAAWAGHEVPYYPSFYPQEIRIEPLTPEAAAREFVNTRDPLHAYVGAAPQFSGPAPADLKPVRSLQSFVVATANRKSERLATREARCRAMREVLAIPAQHSELVRHAYPVTPYHPDYIGHVDRVPDAADDNKAEAQPPLQVRVTESVASQIANGRRRDSGTWDVGIEEVSVADVVGASGASLPAWPTAPWAKQGWFQAYHLLRSAPGGAAKSGRADELYRTLTENEPLAPVQRVTLERELVSTLTQDCERVVLGYRLRREMHSDEFSNGVENISFDSQSGLNAAVALRTIKLKDLPWNGWLRLGVESKPALGWNPVAGFADPAGRLVWSAVGDDAFLPIPHNGAWANNRAEVFPPGSTPAARQSIRIPADAIAVEPDSGRLALASGDAAAMAMLSYRISASVFHDGTAMETADFVFPYALAHRWGGGTAGSAVFDAEIASATASLRQQFKAVRLVRVEHTKLPIADLVFEYHWPIVEVFLDTLSSDEATNALIAPPWSSVPWHVLALLEAAVERGIAAFSRTEAERRGVPWLDIVRDPAQREKLRALVKEFAVSGYRPPPLDSLVTKEAASARWQALDAFAEANGHLLVTNGPYKLRSFTSEVTTLDVIREFTYPIGLGTFDFHAYPPKASITRVEHIGNRILMTADAEIAVKQQRDRRLTRVPFKRDTLRETLPIRPLSRYVVVGADGAVVAAGAASFEPDGRFAATLPALGPGKYRLFGAVLLDGNALDPSIGRIEFEVK